MIYHNFKNSYLVNYYFEDDGSFDVCIAYSKNAEAGSFKQKHFVFKEIPDIKMDVIDYFIHIIKIYIEDPAKLSVKMSKLISEAMCNRATFNLKSERY